MSAYSMGYKTLFAAFTLTVALVGCGRQDSDQAATESQSSAMESRSATASSNAGSSGDSSAGASEGSSGASGAGSATGRAIDDSVITTKAKTALLADTTVKGTDINVETDKGVIVLSGAVEDSRQKERAASIVKGIDGVKSVQNKLTVQK